MGTRLRIALVKAHSVVRHIPGQGCVVRPVREAQRQVERGGVRVGSGRIDEGGAVGCVVAGRCLACGDVGEDDVAEVGVDHCLSLSHVALLNGRACVHSRAEKILLRLHLVRRLGEAIRIDGLLESARERPLPELGQNFELKTV